MHSYRVFCLQLRCVFVWYWCDIWFLSLFLLFFLPYNNTQKTYMTLLALTLKIWIECWLKCISLNLSVKEILCQRLVLEIQFTFLVFCLLQIHSYAWERCQKRLSMTQVPERRHGVGISTQADMKTWQNPKSISL